MNSRNIKKFAYGLISISLIILICILTFMIGCDDMSYTSQETLNESVNVLVETHSEYLVRRSQVLVAEAKYKDEQFPKDLRDAYELGQRLVLKAQN